VEQLNAEFVEQLNAEVVELQFAEIVAAGADQSSVDLDVDHQAPLLGLLSTPRRHLKRACSCGTDDRVRFRKRIRILQQSVRRLKIRCKSMDGVVKELRSRDLVDEHLGTAPNSRFAGMQLSLLKHQVCCIVLLADQFVQWDVASRGGRPSSDVAILLRLQRDVRAAALQKKVFGDLDHHAMDCPPWEAHVPLLITAIVRKFANARLAHLGKTFTDKTMGAASAKRSEKPRLLIFQHV